MKKRFSAFLFLVIVCLFSGILAACENEMFDSHEHTFGSEWETNETWHWHSATCEHVEEVSEKGKHDFETVVLEEATCTLPGISKSTCKVCGFVSYRTIPYGHDINEEWSFDESGHYRLCGACGEKFYSGNHDFEEKTEINATCTEDGLKKYTCKICGYSFNDTVYHTGHAMRVVGESPATCMESGYCEYEVCDKCGHKEGYEYYKALGHDVVSETIREATCNEDGITEYRCQREGCDYIVREIVCGGHVYEESARLEATCTEKGFTEYTCSVCGDVIRHEIESGHDYVAEISVKATKTAEGEITYTCTKCGDVYTEKIPRLPDGKGLVLIIQDNIPWTSNANTLMLENLKNGGLIEGWTMINSHDVANVSLGEYDVVYIANDQKTLTYNNLYVEKSKLENYVADGGVLVYGACDHGWASGAITGLIGEVSKGNYYSYNNYLVNADNPIVTGELTDGNPLTKSKLYHNYTSHTYFTGLPDNAEIILQDEKGKPTLVWYESGDNRGAVILSGLTWEHDWKYLYDGQSESYAKSAYDDMIAFAMNLASPCNHKYNEGETVSPTCTLKGYVLHTCEICGKTLKTDFTDELGHDIAYIDNGENHTAVCGRDGCGYERIDSHVYADCCDAVCDLCLHERVAPHDYTEKFYSLGGYHFRVRRCDCARETLEELKEEIVVALMQADAAYDFDVEDSEIEADLIAARAFINDWLSEINVETTEKTTEEIIDICLSVFGKANERSAVVARQNTEIKEKLSSKAAYYDKVAVMDTALEDLKTSFASAKDELFSLFSGFSAHAFDNEIITEPASCQKEGEITYTCAVCGETHTELITIEHSFSEEWSITARFHYHASTCGCDRITDVEEHSFVNGVCAVCGYTEMTQTHYTPADYFEFTLLADESYSVSVKVDKKSVLPTEIVIPPTYNGKPVTEIGQNGFKGCRTFTKVIIPDSIVTIGVAAFYNCAIADLVIPDSVITISNSAFNACNSMENLKIGKNVQTIGNYAFVDCWKLTNVTLPDSIINIGGHVFDGCTALTEVILSENISRISGSVFANCRNLTAIVLPENVETIGQYAFWNCRSLSTVNLNGTLQSIESWAFCNCSGLEEIILPTSIKIIEENAFTGCSALSVVFYGGTEEEWSVITIDGTETLTNANRYYYSEEYPAEFVENYYWHYENGVPTMWKEQELVCSRGLAYTLNSDGESYTVSGIGDCTDTDIIIPDTYKGKTVNRINENAFSGCAFVKQVNIPQSVISIGRNAFYGCNCEEIYNNLAYVDNWLVREMGGDNNTIIRDDTIGIADDVFWDCYVVTIPSSVKYIGYGAFARCSYLSAINVSESNNIYKSINGNLFSKDGSVLIKYAVGKNDVHYEIPNFVTKIGSLAFYECKNLSDITISNSVNIIENFAFYECISLKNLILPTGVEYIGDYAFCRCSSIVSTILPNTVKIIGDYAFSDCNSLKEFQIGKGVKRMGGYVFAKCFSLKEIEIPDNVENMGRYTFYDCRGLETVIIGNSLSRLENGMFSHCISLKNIVISDNVTSIGDNTFFICDSLTNIYYRGTIEKWELFIDTIKDETLTNANRYYYSEEYPAEFVENYYWHYENGVPTVW